MELLTEKIPLPEAVNLTKPPPPVSVASGVVVKFPFNSKRLPLIPRGGAGGGGQGTAVAAIKKPRRDFFEHDTRNKNKPLAKMKWPGGGVAVKSADQERKKKKFDFLQKGGEGEDKTKCGGGGTSGNSPSSVSATGEKAMNSKARRAAKFREMKVLQRIMLSKEVNMAQLLPNLTSQSTVVNSAGCCHCKCSASVSGTVATMDEHSVATKQRCLTFGGNTSAASTASLMVAKEVEVVKSCSVR